MCAFCVTDTVLSVKCISAFVLQEICKADIERDRSSECLGNFSQLHACLGREPRLGPRASANINSRFFFYSTTVCLRFHSLWAASAAALWGNGCVAFLIISRHGLRRTGLWRLVCVCHCEMAGTDSAAANTFDVKLLKTMSFRNCSASRSRKVTGKLLWFCSFRQIECFLKTHPVCNENLSTLQYWPQNIPWVSLSLCSKFYSQKGNSK